MLGFLAFCIINGKFTESETSESIVIKSTSDIDRIEIETGEYVFQYFNNYIIDFNDNTFTHKILNEDKEKVTHFSDEDKENFVRKANMYGFLSWQESYAPEVQVEDGGYTHFLIIYNDGSQHETWCDNAYPDTYDAMWKTFLELFGDYMI